MEALEGTVPQLLQTLRPHGSGGEVTCCDIAVNGAYLLTGGGDRALRVWRWEPGEGWVSQAVALRAHRYGLTTCRWAPNGALAASGGVDGAARVWAGRNLAPRRLLAAPAAPALRALCWAGAGVLLCGYDDGAACVWHVQRSELLARLHAHEGSLHALAAPARGALFFAACTDGVLKAFDLQEVVQTWSLGEPAPAPLLWVDGAHDLGALCCDAGADGSAVATGGHDARVRLWTVSGAAQARRVDPGPVLTGHSAAVTSIRWARALLASASLDRTARLWTAAGACLVVLHAHPRYLTCVALANDLRYMVTGSNDKSIRMWSISDLSLDSDLEPACNPLSHFGVGDLEGIGPVDEEGLLAVEGCGSRVAAGEGEAAGAARLAWRSLDARAGAVNCISVHKDMLATACSDGVARIFRWSGSELEAQGEVGERGYPALAAELGAGGAILLVAGLDGAARLWDVQSRCMLRSMSAPAGEGGGGVRAARLSEQRPPRLLLATDDGTAPVWSLADSDTDPLYMYEGPVEGATCCAWSSCARVLAVGGAGGELRVLRAPPLPQLLHLVSAAHDIAVQSCDFAPHETLDLSSDSLLLATAGCDALIRLWQIDVDEECCNAVVTAVGSAIGHSGGASSVRWGRTGGDVALVSAGADGWARVWRATRGPGVVGSWQLRQTAAVPTLGAAGSPTAAMLEPGVVVLGSLAGELAVWRLDEGGEAAEEDVGDDAAADEDAGLEPRWWGLAGVTRWLRDYVIKPPDAGSECVAAEAELVGRVAAGALNGARLLDYSIEDLLQIFGYGEKDALSEEESVVRARLVSELHWLRRPPPPDVLALSAPHGLLCPVSHTLQREPARAADGLTYDRAALHEWFLAADGAMSVLSGRVLHSARVAPNYGARDALRRLLSEHGAYVDDDHQQK